MRLQRLEEEQSLLVGPVVLFHLGVRVVVVLLLLLKLFTILVDRHDSSLLRLFTRRPRRDRSKEAAARGTVRELTRGEAPPAHVDAPDAGLGQTWRRSRAVIIRRALAGYVRIASHAISLDVTLVSVQHRVRRERRPQRGRRGLLRPGVGGRAASPGTRLFRGEFGGFSRGFSLRHRRSRAVERGGREPVQSHVRGAERPGVGFLRTGDVDRDDARDVGAQAGGFLRVDPGLPVDQAPPLEEIKHALKRVDVPDKPSARFRETEPFPRLLRRAILVHHGGADLRVRLGRLGLRSPLEKFGNAPPLQLVRRVPSEPVRVPGDLVRLSCGVVRSVRVGVDALVRHVRRVLHVRDGGVDRRRRLRDFARRASHLPAGYVLLDRYSWDRYSSVTRGIRSPGSRVGSGAAVVRGRGGDGRVRGGEVPPHDARADPLGELRRSYALNLGGRRRRRPRRAPRPVRRYRTLRSVVVGGVRPALALLADPGCTAALRLRRGCGGRRHGGVGRVSRAGSRSHSRLGGILPRVVALLAPLVVLDAVHDPRVMHVLRGARPPGDREMLARGGANHRIIRRRRVPPVRSVLRRVFSRGAQGAPRVVTLRVSRVVHQRLLLHHPAHDRLVLIGKNAFGFRPVCVEVGVEHVRHGGVARRRREHRAHGPSRGFYGVPRLHRDVAADVHLDVAQQPFFPQLLGAVAEHPDKLGAFVLRLPVESTEALLQLEPDAPAHDHEQRSARGVVLPVAHGQLDHRPRGR
mmetsp:Transcript_11018/g.45924  ORF Transcript_11018/g.45924 Transcript_11018/m.45924 type:complete len:747 (-) Transcript_11018:240-2480(-)